MAPTTTKGEDSFALHPTLIAVFYFAFIKDLISLPFNSVMRYYKILPQHLPASFSFYSPESFFLTRQLSTYLRRVHHPSLYAHTEGLLLSLTFVHPSCGHCCSSMQFSQYRNWTWWFIVCWIISTAFLKIGIRLATLISLVLRPF